MRISEETKRKIAELWENGLPGSAIAAEVGMTRCAVLGAVSRMRHSGVNLSARSAKERIPMEKLREKPQATTKEKQSPAPIQVAASQTATDLLGLKLESCRYIVDLRNMRDALYCNEPRVRGPYCGHHYSICYVPKQSKAA